MNIVDYFLIFFFTGALYSGYRHGFLKELYDLGALIIALIAAYLLKNGGANIITNYYDFRTLFNLKIEDNIYQLVLNNIKPFLGFTLVFICVWLVIKLILFILIRRKIILNRINRLEWLGSAINGIKTLVYFSILAFGFSFLFLTPYGHLYEDSLFLEPLLKMNVPLYNSQKNITAIYNDTKALKELMELQGGLKNNPETIALIKDLKNNPYVTDDLIIDISKAAINNNKEIDLSDMNIAEFKTNLKMDGNYPLIKSLYDEKVITSDLVYKILEANNISGLTAEQIDSIFK